MVRACGASSLGGANSPGPGPVTVKVRRATIEDSVAMAILHVVCWQEAYVGQLPQEYLDALTAEGRLDMWQRLLAEDFSAEAFLAVAAEEPVAFIAVDKSGDVDATSATGSVNAIYVRSRLWGHGIARELMERGLQELRSRGCNEATLWVLETNRRARRVYDVGGWLVDSSRTDQVGEVEVSELRYRLGLEQLTGSAAVTPRGHS